MDFAFNKINRPKIEVKTTWLSLISDILGTIGVIFLIAYTLYYFGKLPQTIPIHFNISGEADGFGSKYTLIIFPVIATFLHTLFFFIKKSPHIYNYPVKITEQNAEYQYKIAINLIHMVRISVIGLLSVLEWQMVEVSLGNQKDLGIMVLPVFLLLLFGSTIVYFIKAVKNK